MKKRSFIQFLIIGLIIITTHQGNAQNKKHCGTSNAVKTLYQIRPKSKAEALDFNRFTREYLVSSKNKAASEYVIPVVFHVYGTNFNGYSLNNTIITEAIQKTNEDFQGLTADWNNIIPEFDGVKKSLNISFKLAQIDPNGNATTGIIYYPNAAGYGNGGGYDTQIQQDAWDNYKYMNVYIQNDLYNDGTTNNSGVAWYPDTWMSDNDLSRVVYNGAYLGSNTDENFRSVLTHEFGHWLNLIHTFEDGCPDAINCSESGDLICDTPPADESSMNGTLNCQGVVTNWENFMDYSSNYSMFTIEQVARMEAALQHSTRFPLWQDANLNATGVNGNLGPRLVVGDTRFEENYVNDGSIDNEISISAIDGAEFALTELLTEGTHFTVSNLPAGLEIKINVENSTSATLTIIGNANTHNNADDISNISITFLDASIVGGVASLLTPDIIGLSIDFIPPYEIIYENITDITASSSSTWTYFEIDNGHKFGIWVENGDLRFETYKKPMICEAGTKNISLIPYNEEINSDRNWVAGGDYPDEHDIRTSAYTIWDGETGYMGFQFISNGHPCYGWFKITVSSNGNSYTLHEYAYNQEPYASIAAGTQNVDGDLTSYHALTNENNGGVTIYPNPANRSLTINLKSDSRTHAQLFTMNGKLIKEQYLTNSNSTIDISEIKKGMYFIRLNSSGNTNTEKIIIE